MAKEWAKPFYNSKAWKAARQRYIDERVLIDGGLCEVCHKRPGTIVHHKIMLSEKNIDDPNVSLNLDNFQLDCKPCHDREEDHFIVVKKELKCSFDENGQPQVISKKGCPIR